VFKFFPIMVPHPKVLQCAFGFNRMVLWLTET
jgi:hypothetical protein